MPDYLQENEDISSIDEDEMENEYEESKTKENKQAKIFNRQNGIKKEEMEFD